MSDGYQRLLDHDAERAMQQAVREDADSRSRRSMGLLALALALPVNLMCPAWLLLGGWLMTRGLWLGALGLLAVLIGLATLPGAPRPGWRRGPRPHRLGPADLPELFAVMSDVAAVTGAPLPRWFTIDTDFNAHVRRVRRHAELTVGAPLWVVLPPSARVGLLGHELGHLAHRDLLDGAWVGWARKTAVFWYLVGSEGGNGAPLWERLAVGWIAVLPAGYLRLLDTVNAAAHRRREYLADLDALAVAGTDGALALFDTLLASATVETAMTRAVARGGADVMWASVRDAVGSTTADQVQARRRAATVERSRIDDSHPRTSLRITMVQQRPHLTQSVVPDPARWARVDAELAPHLVTAARQARDAIHLVH